MFRRNQLPRKGSVDIRQFDLKFTKGNTIAAPNKLLHLQKRYAQKYVEEEGKEYLAMIDRILAVVEQHLQARPEIRICGACKLRDRIAALLNVDAMNYTTPSNFVERHSQFFFLERREEYQHRSNDVMLSENFSKIIDRFRKVLPEQWGEPSLREALENVVNTLSMKWGQDLNQIMDLEKATRASVQHFLRWALTGGRPGPTLMLTMSILGRDASLKRIEEAAAVLERKTFEANNSSA